CDGAPVAPAKRTACESGALAAPPNTNPKIDTVLSSIPNTIEPTDCLNESTIRRKSGGLRAPLPPATVGVRRSGAVFAVFVMCSAVLDAMHQLSGSLGTRQILDNHERTCSRPPHRQPPGQGAPRQTTFAGWGGAADRRFQSAGLAGLDRQM